MIYGATADRYDRHGNQYMEVGDKETTSYDEAMEAARGWAASHPNASSQILRDGDPYLWVSHSYDLGKDETTVHVKDLEFGHERTTATAHLPAEERTRAWLDTFREIARNEARQRGLIE